MNHFLQMTCYCPCRRMRSPNPKRRRKTESRPYSKFAISLSLSPTPISLSTFDSLAHTFILSFFLLICDLISPISCFCSRDLSAPSSHLLSTSAPHISSAHRRVLSPSPTQTYLFTHFSFLTSVRRSLGRRRTSSYLRPTSSRLSKLSMGWCV